MFDFFGELSHSLFGTARDGDIDNVRQTMQRIKARQDLVLSTWEQAEARMSSFGETVNHRLDTMSSMIETQKTAIHTLFTDVMRQSSNQAQVGSMLAMALGRLEDFVVLQNHLSSFQAGLEMLSSGCLSPVLISPRDLFQALMEISSRVQTDFRQTEVTFITT